jgi:hypothetical protein
VTDRRSSGERGPLPVRDLLKQTQEGATPAEPASLSDRAGTGESAPAGGTPLERSFEVAGEEWVARPAGIGLYGTGRPGTARLMAVHFFRAADPGAPIREALVPAGEFVSLAAGELSDLFERATPIELER